MRFASILESCYLLNKPSFEKSEGFRFLMTNPTKINWQRL